MDDITKVGIEFEVSTAQARTEVEKLNKTITENTTAAKGAGTEQKKLGAEVNATRARQIEATEALRRAKEVQQEHNLVVQAFGPRSREAAESGKKLAAATEESKRAALAAAKALGDVTRAALAAAQAEGDKLNPATKRAAAQLVGMAKDAARAETEIHRLDLSITAAAKAAEKGSKSWSAAFSSFAGNMGANAVSAVTSKLQEGVGWVLQTGASYETLRVALETTTGSSAKAASEFERLQKFAAATPFGVQELTESFIKLGNRGIEPTDRLLTAMGNTASAMGKTLDDFTEAIADAVTGENERLKEFGIVGKKNGDMIAYTFRGVTTEVKFSADAITEYLTQIGESNFAGGMERQSQTLAGMWSTMLDNAAALADEFTQGLAPALKEIMEGFGGVDEEGRATAQSLGEKVGEGLKSVVDMATAVIETLSGDNGMIAQFALLGGAALALTGPFGAAAAAGWQIGKALSDMWDEVPPEMRDLLRKGAKITAEEEKNALAAQAAEFEGMHAEMDRVRAVSEKQDDLFRRWSAAQAKRGEKTAKEIERAAIGFKQAVDGQNRMLGGGTGADRLAAWESQTTRLENENEYNELRQDKTLSPSEKKRLAALQKELDIASPVKPKKGKKKKEAKEISSDSDRGGRAVDLDASIYASDAIAAESMEAPRAAAQAEQEAAAERRLLMVDREIEAMDAMGAAQREQVDILFWQLDVESEAESRRADLQEERIKRELELARTQVRNAKTTEDREKAQTKVEEIEHKKRLLSIQRATEVEEKEQARKLHAFTVTNNSIQALGGSVIDALEAQADGEERAVARGVASLAEGVRNKLILKSIEEGVLGAAAAAGILTAALAPPHFAAAGIAAAGALAAQGVASAFNARAGSGGSGSAGASIPSGGSGGGYGGAARSSSTPSSSGSGDGDAVPTSYNDGNQYVGKMAAKSDAANGATYNIQVLGATTEQVGTALKRVIRTSDRSLGNVR